MITTNHGMKVLKSMSKQPQFIMNIDTCIKKKYKQKCNKLRLLIIKDIYVYMQTALIVVYTQIHAKKVIKLFGERDIAAKKKNQTII